MRAACARLPRGRAPHGPGVYPHLPRDMNSLALRPDRPPSRFADRQRGPAPRSACAGRFARAPGCAALGCVAGHVDRPRCTPRRAGRRASQRAYPRHEFRLRRSRLGVMVLTDAPTRKTACRHAHPPRRPLGGAWTPAAGSVRSAFLGIGLSVDPLVAPARSEPARPAHRNFPWGRQDRTSHPSAKPADRRAPGPERNAGCPRAPGGPCASADRLCIPPQCGKWTSQMPCYLQ
jgi:hypothetical protein